MGTCQGVCYNFISVKSAVSSKDRDSAFHLGQSTFYFEYSSHRSTREDNFIRQISQQDCLHTLAYTCG